MKRFNTLRFCLLAALLLFGHGFAQSTPVIGGACKLGSGDVQIGGKQTQFFLKCEANNESEEGSGVWTVKSRAASPPAGVQLHPKNVAAPKMAPTANICEQDTSALEGAGCIATETCLQQNYADSSSYLQCDQASKVWVKKACQENAAFNFEGQSCVAGLPKRTHHCSTCPLGTGCDSSALRCVPLNASHLCPDRSSPHGVCPCSKGFVCTSQNVCCRQSNVYCPEHDRCERICPSHKFCSSLTHCCRSLRRRGDVSQGGIRSFAAQNEENSSDSMKTIASRILKQFMIAQTLSPPSVAPRPEITVSPPSTLAPISKECGRLEKCLAHTAICPRNHRCVDGCCELLRCPNFGVLARKLPACASVYQCPKNSECISGRCCPTMLPTVSTTLYRLSTTTETPTMTSMIPAHTTTTLILADSYESAVVPTSDANEDEFLKAQRTCRIDPLALATTCSLSEPCPEDSECLEGKCCLLPDTLKCASGLFALQIPEFCARNEDCPLGALCERRKCCPLAEESPETTVISPTVSSTDSSIVTTTSATPENTTRSVYESRLCPNGAESLSTPANCLKCDDCPEGYDCKKGLCCTVGVLDYGSEGEPQAVISLLDYGNEVSERTTSDVLTTNTLMTGGPTANTLSPLDYEEVVSGDSNDTLSEAIDLQPTTTVISVLPASAQRTLGPMRVMKLREATVPFTPSPTEEKENCLGELCRMKITEGNKACPAGKCKIPAPIVHAGPEECSEEYCRQCGVLCARKICCFHAVVLHDQPTLGAISEKDCLEDSEGNCAGGLPCPSGFTCAEDGKRCCRVDERCPYGKVPERMCSQQDPFCLSSEEQCVPVGTRAACCLRDYCIPDGYPVGGGLVCTFSSCSAQNPCQVGNCNNGYCCHSGASQAPAPIVESNTNNSTTTNTTSTTVSNATVLEPAADWPVGPPGFGFPSELVSLDQVLVKASGDGTFCAAGFRSPLPCAAGGCPPGLFCDAAIQRCCPLLLPLTDGSNPKNAPSSSPSSVKRQQQRFSVTTIQASGSSSPQIITIPAFPAQTQNTAGGCAVGCPRGFSGCCGTQQASCCQRQQCPGNLPPTGRSCYTSCPAGQICVSGMCCPQMNTPQITCPGGSQPYGMCNNGYCSQGYQCIQSTGMCCAVIQQSYSCPGGASSIGQCINGQCGNGYSCNAQSNLCCQATNTRNPFVCPDGTQAAGACVNGKCGGDFKCTNGLCCAHTSTTPRCLDGTEAVGACLNGRCGDGYTCTVGNICCLANMLGSCPIGQEAVGPCVGGLCPNGYTCHNNMCCGAENPVDEVFQCVDPLDGIAPCMDDGTCRDSGFKCDLTEGAPGTCCPNPVADQRPVRNMLTCDSSIADPCPENTACVGGLNGRCMLINPCEDTAIGPCMDGSCPGGNTCNNGFCCPNGRLHRAPQQLPAYGNSHFRSYSPSVGSCPGGAAAVGGCINGGCGSGFSCLNGVCCPAAQNALQFSPGRSLCPNGMPAVGGCFNGGVCGTGYACDVTSNMCCSVAAAQTNNYNRVCSDGSNPLGSCPTGQDTCPRGYRCHGTICCRPSSLPYYSEIAVGGRCDRDQECVGSQSQLTTCVAGICRCLPEAYSRAPFPCVRSHTKHFRMNDSPIAEENNATEASTTAAPEPAQSTTTAKSS